MNTKTAGAIRSGLRAPSAQKIDDQADQHHEAQTAAADGGAAKIETAAAKQEQKNKYQKEKVHGCRIARRYDRFHGALPYPAKAVRVTRL